ncbi:hypothetical protein Y032_0101g3348 [Ancylostoma ceylanicum]|uniref:Uncharacterized protein n=1 Tax=Ancylostoma ceylanicum TaxID=53326 RepID=A0A016THI3_9BILA|nr:hypothetical protein Y032_0101g3348 [Ancylostoma ceylanicum]
MKEEELLIASNSAVVTRGWFILENCCYHYNQDFLDNALVAGNCMSLEGVVHGRVRMMQYLAGPVPCTPASSTQRTSKIPRITMAI